MTAGERLKSWIDGFAMSVKDRLRGWMASWVSVGFTAFLESAEPGVKEAMTDTLTRIRDYPHTTPEIKKAIDDAIAKPDWEKTLSGYIWYHLGIIPSILQSGTAFANLVGYDTERLVRTFRLDPLSVITAWRRDKPTYEKYFEDLVEQGWSDDRIEALKFFTLFYPAPADLIRWQAREVFEPEMIARYGLDSEFEAIEKEPFYKAGMTDEQILNYWRAHWEHASWMQVVEMLHRGLLTEEQVWDWFRVVEIPPFWRQKLIDSAYTWPTRVDVRRWWDMRTIDEAELRRLYSGMGYRGINLDNYVLWTKVYVAFPDLMARWSKGWITLDEVRAELAGLGMPADRVEEMIQTKIKAAEPERVEEGKALTKTEIYKGVKKDIITWEEGIELLMDLGYDYEEADYILTINVEALAGSPETFVDFKNITTKYKLATGKEAKPMPEEIKIAAEEVVKLTGEVSALAESVKGEEEKLILPETAPEEAAAHLKELRVSLHRAESALAAAKDEYEKLVAEWKHAAL